MGVYVGRAKSQCGEYVFGIGWGERVDEESVWYVEKHNLKTRMSAFIKLLAFSHDLGTMLAVFHKNNEFNSNMRIVDGWIYQSFGPVPEAVPPPPRLIDRDTGTILFELNGHVNNKVHSAVFAPDNTFVVTGSSDKTARIWSVAIGETIRVLDGHPDSVWCVAVSPDSRYVATGSYQTVYVWSVDTGERVKTFNDLPWFATCVAFSPDGNFLLAGSQYTVYVWSMETNEEIKKFTGHSSFVDEIIVSPDSTWFATASHWDTYINRWDMNTTTKMNRLEVSHMITSLAVSPDGKSFAVASSYDGVRILDVETGDVVKTTTLQHGMILNAVV